jgi:Ca-activated chloride channel family protein
MRMRNFSMLAIWGLLAAILSIIVGCSTSRELMSYSDTANQQGGGSPAPSEMIHPAQMMRPPRTIEADLVAPQSLPSRDEELWVIEKHPANGEAKNADVPGTGSLLARLPDKPTETVPVPLKHTEVKADVAGYIATVDVTQQFHNPYASKIEAVYVFPLPENAAVNEFVMTIGTRKIRGIIREREEAKRIYDAAKNQGYVASLLTQERPNIFTQSVANIEPGKEIDINIKYFQTLGYSDGWYQFVFPMVVGPRFNPPGSVNGVGAVARGGKGVSGQSTEVQYLAPHERSGHDIGLSVHIDAGVAIEAVECKTHQIQKADAKPNGADVKLAAGDSIPNRDFVLRYKVAGKTIKSAVMVQRDRDNQGGYFTVMLFPPESMAQLPRKPLEMVFTIDVSGSQSGIPIAQEKAAVKYALGHMNAGDTFQVIRFGNTATKLFPAAQPANDQNVTQAIRWIDALDATEGTMLVDGLRASLLFPHDEQRLRYVTFLTDGFIGNESEALAEIHNDLGPSRIFSFGSGSATNRYLLERMAKLGNGAAAYLGPRDSADEVMAQFLNRISHPAMTDLSIDFGGAQVADVYPQRLGDLYVGRPVIISGRFTGGGEHVIKVKGTIAGEKREIPITLKLDESAAQHPAIAAVWARMKIADLADHAAYEPNADLPQQIKQVALEYGLMSSFTAFVAVDSMTRTSGDHGTTIAVPVPVPEGVRYETTVTPKQGEGALPR